MELSFDEFIEKVIVLAGTNCFGFTCDKLRNKKGLKKFSGFE